MNYGIIAITNARTSNSAQNVSNILRNVILQNEIDIFISIPWSSLTVSHSVSPIHLLIKLSIYLLIKVLPLSTKSDKNEKILEKLYIIAF